MLTGQLSRNSFLSKIMVDVFPFSCRVLLSKIEITGIHLAINCERSLENAGKYYIEFFRCQFKA